MVLMYLPMSVRGSLVNRGTILQPEGGGFDSDEVIGFFN
jgi:hypothetical protein